MILWADTTATVPMPTLKPDSHVDPNMPIADPDAGRGLRAPGGAENASPFASNASGAAEEISHEVSPEVSRRIVHDKNLLCVIPNVCEGSPTPQRASPMGISPRYARRDDTPSRFCRVQWYSW